MNKLNPIDALRREEGLSRYMKKTMETISYLALVLIVAAPSLFYAGKIDLDMSKTLMAVATVIWFASALCWMGREDKA